tara:strand:- start:454 stop:1713 length:1260 start_codon:yes stop_codon:yes gene_type:complete
MEEQYYLNFENAFRGSRDEIYNRLGKYDGIIQYIISNHKRPNVLDIGSGRGEWLQKCREAGFVTKGIELNTDMVQLCKGLELDILEGDALATLREIKSESYGLITSFHLIEHLNFDVLSQIIKQCKRILKPDGLLILETPSIDNINVATRQFYLDPTHINPINPEGIVFLIEQCGFHQAKYFFINGGPLEKSNRFSITRMLNGVAQDMLVIATPNSISSRKFYEAENLWKGKLNIALETIQAAVQFDECAREMENKINEMESIIDKMESIIESQRQQIDFLLFRQEKIYQSFPLKTIKILKNIFFTRKINLLLFVNKFFNRSILIFNKSRKKILNIILEKVIIIFKKMMIIFKKIKLNLLVNYLSHLIKKIYMYLNKKNDYKYRKNILLRKKQNGKLLNHSYLSKSANEIYNQIKNNRS